LGRKRYVDHEVLANLSIEEEITARRYAFRYTLDPDGEALLADDGSRSDAEVKLNSPGDIVRHVPRALVVGLFAPFPNMWLHSGKQVGLSGRAMSGFEILLTFVI